MLHIVSIVFFLNLQAMVHTLDIMFSQRRGLKIGRKHRKIDVIKRSPEFIACDSLSDRLITLALISSTSSVERVFSAMNIIKSYL
jgi:hypothetical protein